MNIIEAKNLSKSFRTRTNRNIITGIWRPEWKYTEAVSSVSFSIEAGESVAFLGPNGAGKTTTTKMMTGLIYPSSGSVHVLDHNPFERDHRFLRHIGLIMGNKAGLNWDLTANQSFWLLQKIYDIDDDVFRNRLSELSDMLHVSHKLDDQVRRLSLGERMKVELIGALLHNPKVLFLDEPTIGLDIEAKKTVRVFLRNVQQEYGTTLVLTSHDMDDIEYVCDRVLVINHGEIAYDDSIQKLLAKYNTHKYLRFHLKETANLADLQKHGEVVSTDNGVLLKIPTSKMTKTLGEITNSVEVDDINIESTPLETIIGDIFSRQK